VTKKGIDWADALHTAKRGVWQGLFPFLGGKTNWAGRKLCRGGGRGLCPDERNLSTTRSHGKGHFFRGDTKRREFGGVSPPTDRERPTQEKKTSGSGGKKCGVADKTRGVRRWERQSSPVRGEGKTAGVGAKNLHAKRCWVNLK